MTSALQIRDAEDSDFEQLANIHASCFPKAWDANALRELSNAAGAVSLAALINEKLAGFVMLRVAADEAEILTVAVAPDYQRHGIGESLLQEAAKRAGQQGANQIFLEVASNNTAALGLYAKLVFEPVGQRKAYYSSANENTSQDAVTMRAYLPLPRKSLWKAR